MEKPMPPSFGYGAPPGPDPVEFTFEDVVLNTWADDSGDYLQLDAEDVTLREVPPSDQG
jgi:hypothetical protein